MTLIDISTLSSKWTQEDIDRMIELDNSCDKGQLLIKVLELEKEKYQVLGPPIEEPPTINNDNQCKGHKGTIRAQKNIIKDLQAKVIWLQRELEEKQKFINHSVSLSELQNLREFQKLTNAERGKRAEQIAALQCDVNNLKGIIDKQKVDIARLKAELDSIPLPVQDLFQNKFTKT